MVLQVLVRQSRYQRAAVATMTTSTSQHPQPPSATATATHTTSNANSQSNTPVRGGGAAAPPAQTALSGSRRASSVPLTSPGSLPMAVIGNPSAVAPAAMETPERYTQIVAVWQADCLVCGLSPFDADTLVLFGYPVDEIVFDSEEEREDGGDSDGDVGPAGVVVFGGGAGGGTSSAGFDSGIGLGLGVDGGGGDAGAKFQPEVQLVTISTGEVSVM